MERFSTNEIQPFEIKHQQLVRKLSSECVVLLEKDGNFPLKNPAKVALFGNGARRTLKGGTGSGDVNARHVTSIEEGLNNAGFEIISSTWLDSYEELYNSCKEKWIKQIQEEAKAAHVHSVLYGMGKSMPEPEYNFPLDTYGNDLAIYVLSRISGEGTDRRNEKGDMYLTDTEERDIKFLNNHFKRFILILNVGGYVDLSNLGKVKNILLLGQLGSPIGDICADLLLGKSYPSGKLTMTWAKLEDYPSTEGFDDPSDTYYHDDVYVGYKYFNMFKDKIQYPFGFGLSYTEFDISANLKEINKENGIVEISIRNIGNNKGKEVVQLYVQSPKNPLKLISFKKSKELDINELDKIDVSFSLRDFASFEENKGLVIEEGDYTLLYGNCSNDLKVLATFHSSKDKVIETYPSILRSKEQLDVISFEQSKYEACKPIINLDEVEFEIKHYKEHVTEEPFKEVEPFSFKDVLSKKRSIEDFVSSLNDEELALLCIGDYKVKGEDISSAVGEAGTTVAGAAGETCRRFLSNKDLPTINMADGPAGLRIAKEYILLNGRPKPLSGGFTQESEFLTEEEKQIVEMLMGTPSEEEKTAQHYFQNPTAIPVGTAIAQSFNPTIAYDFGDLVGNEMKIFGVDIWLSPAMNIMRNPLCGRNFEYYSEDPLLTGLIAGAICKGVQSHKGKSTTIKHFACNNQEFNRVVSNSIVSEKAIREIYVKAFEIAIKEGKPNCIMTANNLINDEHSCEKKDLINTILREQFKFDGIVMSDWFVSSKNMCSMFKGSRWEEASTAKSVEAGNDLMMPGEETDKQNILENINKKLSKRELQNCVYRILKLIVETQLAK